VTGPLDVVVIEFPGDRFKGEIIPCLTEAVEHGAIRVIDVTFIRKDSAGTVTSYELAELEEHEAVSFDLVDATMGLLSVADIDQIGAWLAPDSSAALLVVDHCWAAELEQAALGAGGRFIEHQRVTPEVAKAALADARTSTFRSGRGGPGEGHS